VLSILFGILTACCFASGTLASSRTVRTIGPYSTIAGIMFVGLLITLPFLFIAGVPEQLDLTSGLWLAAGGLGNLVGLILAYSALKIGKVGVVAPILCTEGAIAAVLAALTGEAIAAVTSFILVAIVAGVVLAAVAPDPEPLAHEQPLKAAIIATLGAFAFAVGLFAPGHLSGDMPISWILLPARLFGVIALLIPLLLTRRFRMTKKAAPLVVLTGFTEVIGFTFYSLGAASSVAITAVLASLFAPIAAIAAYFLFKERLGRLQIAAVAVIVASVVALTVSVN
jgi:drug/metabolite transporter (DMT)-like permease